jgi:hypothetical protein
MTCPWRSSRIYLARSPVSVTGRGRMVRSVRPQCEPLAFRQMAGRHHHEVAAIEGGDLAEVEAFG